MTSMTPSAHNLALTVGPATVTLVASAPPVAVGVAVVVLAVATGLFLVSLADPGSPSLPDHQRAR
jgi:hypothetical protein